MGELYRGLVIVFHVLSFGTVAESTGAAKPPGEGLDFAVVDEAIISSRLLHIFDLAAIPEERLFSLDGEALGS
jgi:hypothetical protein